MNTIAVTIGDHAGVGPEILLRSYERLKHIGTPIIYGDHRVLAWAQNDLYKHGFVELKHAIVGIEHPKDAVDDALCVIDCGPSWAFDIESPYPWGQVVPHFGLLQYEALIRAISDTLDHQTSAVVTCPWHKARLLDAGLPATGHTEVLEQQTSSPEATMVLCGDTLRVALETIHVPLKAVPQMITTDGIVHTCRTFYHALQSDWGIAHPRIAVCGLNPHAGESGVIGTEDQAIIAPAIAALQREGIAADGPYPADTIFPLVAHGEKPYDGIVAMYHDQGLGPLKTWHFGHAANVTIGMPIIRTSVDHGTAYDIAGKGIARTSSLEYAYGLAVEMVANRKRLSR